MVCRQRASCASGEAGSAYACAPVAMTDFAGGEPGYRDRRHHVLDRPRQRDPSRGRGARDGMLAMGIGSTDHGRAAVHAGGVPLCDGWSHRV